MLIYVIFIYYENKTEVIKELKHFFFKMSEHLNSELNEHSIWIMSTVLGDLIHNNSLVCPSGNKLENANSFKQSGLKTIEVPKDMSNQGHLLISSNYLIK